MKMSLSLKQSAEKLGISFSHYDINGHLIDASPTRVDYFIEQLQFPPNIGQNQPFPRMMSREASIGIDGVYYNPAGVVGFVSVADGLDTELIGACWHV